MVGPVTAVVVGLCDGLLDGFGDGFIEGVKPLLLYTNIYLYWFIDGFNVGVCTGDIDGL